MNYNKVEICGVNTSKLKVLTEKEKRALLTQMKNGTPQEQKKAREELINGNLRLVLSVIQRFTNRGENLDDLFQVGCIGLIKAIDNFDISQDVRFSTYGVPMIIGEIRRFLRDNNSVRVSRSLRDTAYKAMQVKERLTTQNNKEPSIEEIAKELELPKEDVVLALEAIVEPVSLYEPVFSDGNDTIFVMDQVGDKNDDNNWLDEIALKEAIRNLGPREKKILNLRWSAGWKREAWNELKITFKEFFERFRSGTASPPEKPQHKALKAISQQETPGTSKMSPAFPCNRNPGISKGHWYRHIGPWALPVLGSGKPFRSSFR